MSRQFWSETIGWATALGTAVANSNVETIIFPDIVIPGNFLQDGRVLRLRLFGKYGTTATPTLTFALRLGGVAGTVLAKSGAITTGSGVGGGASMTAMWEMEILLQVQSNGSAGNVMANGSFTLYTTGTAVGSSYPVAAGSTGGTTPVAVAANLTADAALSPTVIWSAANAANSIQGINYTLEALN